MTTQRVMGLDLSLRATGIALIPLDWDCQLDRVITKTVGFPLAANAPDGERIERCERIAAECKRLVYSHGVIGCWIEGYAFGQGQRSAHLGELGGIVRQALRSLGCPFHTAPLSSARKLLLGKTPKGKGAAKRAVVAALRASGAPASWTVDEYEAVVIANYGISELGIPCLAQAAP
jgi:hypothetical protein